MHVSSANEYTILNDRATLSLALTAVLIIPFFLLQFFVVLVGHCKPLLPCSVFHVDETICSSLDMSFPIVSPAAHLYSRCQSLSGPDQAASPAALNAALGFISSCTSPYSPIPNHTRLLWRWPLYNFRRLLLHIVCAALTLPFRAPCYSLCPAAHTAILGEPSTVLAVLGLHWTAAIPWQRGAGLAPMRQTSKVCSIHPSNPALFFLGVVSHTLSRRLGSEVCLHFFQVQVCLATTHLDF